MSHLRQLTCGPIHGEIIAVTGDKPNIMMPVRPHLPRLLGAAALLLFAGLAQAQYAWIDEKGVRHFSDRPPPPTTPAAKVLKAPAKPLAAQPQQDKSAEPTAEAAPAAGAGKPTLAEREADYRKRAQERAKVEQKEAAEAQHRQAKAQDCHNARRYKALLDTGIRVSDVDEHGEKRYISDDERARKAAQASKVIEGCR